MDKLNDIKLILNEINPELEVYSISLDKIIFEERVKLKCFHCKKRNVNWTCPPKIPELDYTKLLNEYENISVVIKVSIIDNLIDFDSIRTNSTNELHRSLLKAEKVLWERNQVMAVSLIGGSCKLCKNGCGIDKCNNPDLARIPIEALGINVIKTVENIGIDVTFPITDKLYRIGLLLW
jgi:predicted metal-binding protein